MRNVAKLSDIDRWELFRNTAEKWENGGLNCCLKISLSLIFVAYLLKTW